MRKSKKNLKNKKPEYQARTILTSWNKCHMQGAKYFQNKFLLPATLLLQKFLSNYVRNEVNSTKLPQQNGVPLSQIMYTTKCM